MPDSTSNIVSFPTDPNDQRPLPEIIADRFQFKLAHADDEEGKRYYSVQDWISGVGQVTEPRKVWEKLKKRLMKAGVELSPSWRQLPYRAANGRRYLMDYAQAETLYQVTQRMDANTGLRNEILQFLARAGVSFDEMRIDPDKAIDAGVEAYRRQGKSDKWIETRLKGKAQRLKFTASFRKVLLMPPQPKHYAIITDTMRRGLWGRTTRVLLQQLNLKKNDNLRDNMSSVALAYEALSEQLSALEFELKGNLSFEQAQDIVYENSESVGKHAEERGRRLGIDLATNHPLLNG